MLIITRSESVLHRPAWPILSGAMNVLILQWCVVFFLCVCLCTRESVEITLQFQTMRVVSCSKMNLVGALGDSERSEECIDFTMLCVFFLFFFLCLCTRESVEITLQFQTMGVVSCRKMNLVGVLGRSFFEFQILREKPKKIMTEKREFLRKTSLRPNRIFFMVVIQKLITENT
ncbi:Uncharacterized protein FWK35_00014620 [Aphis craccivora]|uniref:Uncharacterized protein n=1 Tax=Aphis craccivora TaxID=307492 RepID=A0A6G0ZBM4_APHCR|nr:Uncharacterized protein FWK35_00014620 [Aphis craccivora]